MKAKIRVKRIILILIVVFSAIFIFKNFGFDFKHKLDSYSPNLTTNEAEYKVIKLDTNSKYQGIGQQQVSGKDGYFTTFTDISGKTYKEYKQNGTASWANKKYWDGVMCDTGCGITALSIILSGYNYKYTPEYLRDKYYPVLDGSNISKELTSTFNITNTDFYYDDVSLSKGTIFEHLNKNKPVLACVWNKPNNNRWTTASHYMVLLATDNEDMVYISNPNGLTNTSKSSGWYDFNEIGPYIAKALFITK